MDINNNADLGPLTVIVTAIQALLTTVSGWVANILASVNALPILEETGGTFTTDGTVQNLYINNAPTGVYRPMSLNIDLSNHTAAETIQFRTLYRNVAGGALVERDILALVGALDSPSINIDLEPNRFGIQVTAQLTAGANYALTWEVFYEVAP